MAYRAAKRTRSDKTEQVMSKLPQLDFFPIPKTVLRLYLGSCTSKLEQADIKLVPSTLMPSSIHSCTISPGYNNTLELACSTFNFEGMAVRARVDGKNVLEVQDEISEVELVRAIFQVARDVGCDYVSARIPDLVSCI